MHNFRRQPILESITIAAPLERCFALSTRVELVKHTLGMNLVAPKEPGEIDRGHVTDGSRVHWRGLKFGLPTHHHTLITGYAAPHPAAARGEQEAEAAGQPIAWFQDSQERGRFAFFQHDHFLREFSSPDGSPHTELHDQVRFTLPFGFPGRLVAQYLLAPHIRRLARQRFRMIKALAEGDGWREWA